MRSTYLPNDFASRGVFANDIIRHLSVIESTPARHSVSYLLCERQKLTRRYLWFAKSSCFMHADHLVASSFLLLERNCWLAHMLQSDARIARAHTHTPTQHTTENAIRERLLQAHSEAQRVLLKWAARYLPNDFASRSVFANDIVRHLSVIESTPARHFVSH
jgi:hypothetical protein